MSWHRRPSDNAWTKVTLASVEALGQRIWLRCNSCGHDRIETSTELATRAGLDIDTPLLLVAEALKCVECGERKAHCWPEPYGAPLRQR